MAITFTAIDTKFSLKNKRNIKDWIKAVIVNHEKRVGAINYIFCKDDYILDINQKYLNHDYYTDIITFDYSSKDKLEGDIFISLQTVESNSIKFSTTFDHELMRVIIHGILHLAGLEDKTKTAKQLMRSAEDAALEIFYKTTK